MADSSVQTKRQDFQRIPCPPIDWFVDFESGFIEAYRQISSYYGHDCSVLGRPWFRDRLKRGEATNGSDPAASLLTALWVQTQDQKQREEEEEKLRQQQQHSCNSLH